MAVRTWLAELPPEECTRLLAGSILGRVAVFVDGRPEIFPVNHVYDEGTGCVVFPTNARTKLWGALHWPWVSFEVDRLEPDGRAGWSVLVVGRAEEVREPEVVHRALGQRRVLWAVGPHTRWLRIVPSRISGRRISAVQAP